MSGPPTQAEIAARRQAEIDKKKKREAEWTLVHPAWFLAIMRNDIPALHGFVHAPGFELENRYTVITETTPLGWATICNRAEMVTMLVEAGAEVDAEIKFWGNQTWKPKDYCKNYNVLKALHALETAKKTAKTLEKGVDFD